MDRRNLLATLTGIVAVGVSARWALNGFVLGGSTAEGATAKDQVTSSDHSTRTTSLSLDGWNVLPVGAGGYVTSIQFDASGNTAVISTDVGGGYVAEAPNFLWRQLITPSSLPTPAAAYYGQNNPLGDNIYTDAAGMYAVAVAPSDANRIYAVWQGYVLKSVDRGKTFSRTNMPRAKAFANAGLGRLVARKLVVDPINPEVVYFAGMSTGIWRTLDGGANWTQVSAVTPNTAIEGNQFAVVCIDHTSAPVNHRKSKVYFASYARGFHGSTDGGSSFALLNGTADKVTDLKCDSVGAIYVCQATGVSRWEKDAFSTISTPVAAHTVAIDPANNNRLIAMDLNAFCTVSTDRGETWEEVRNAGTNVQNSYGWDVLADDIPWLAQSTVTNPSHIIFRPGRANDLWMSMGIGVMRANFPDGPVASNRLQYHSVSAGIEQLVAHWILSPPGNPPIVCSWDRPLFRKANLTGFPRDYGPERQLRHCASADYASDNPKYVAALVSHFGANPAQYSCYSEDGGSSWIPFKSQPMNVEGGSLAVNEVGNIVVFPQANGVPRFTLDNGVTWADISFGTAFPAETGFGFQNMSQNRQIAAADKTAPGTFYVYNYGPAGSETTFRGLWKSVNGGRNWFRANSTAIAANATYHSTLRCVLNKTGHLLFAAGDVGGLPNPSDTDFMFSIDGGVNFAPIRGFKEVKHFDCGKAAEGHDYPAIYVLGYYKGVFSFFRCYNFDSGTGKGTWENLGLPNSVDDVTCVGADSDILGRIYVGFKGTGYAYGNHV